MRKEIDFQQSWNRGLNLFSSGGIGVWYLKFLKIKMCDFENVTFAKELMLQFIQSGAADSQTGRNSIRKTVYYSKLILLQRFDCLEWNLLLRGVIYLIIYTYHYFIGCLGYPDPGPHIRPSDPGSQKIFNQLNLLLLKVQSLGSYTNYFQWFMDYLKHFDLLMPHVHVLKKLPYCLMST